ncbi:MAG: hypothetical protein KDA20_10425 [Phycisphaerales bacterium]|nr:hypothetical protein [Phycisphaerales bacterium]
MQGMIKIAAGLALLSGTAIAGTWVEVGDAADALSGYQLTNGVGSLDAIDGATSTTGGDWVDAYCIKIVDPLAFFASTSDLVGPGSASFDTRLFLFDINTGAPLLMNDDRTGSTPSFRSLLSGPSFWAANGGGAATTDNPQEVVAGQDYILAIAGYSNMVEDAALVDNFTVDTTFAFSNLYGPNPAAGAPDHWENATGDASGTYHIALAGVTYSVPAPGALTLLGAGGLVAFRRRR